VTAGELVAGSDDIISEMREYYRARARWHDDYMGYTDNTSMEHLLCPIVEFVERMLSGCDVLEVACGTGNWTQILARRVGRVLATDISDGALLLAREKEYFGGAVTFLVADAFSLEGVSGVFSGAFGADWLSHVPLGRMRGFLRVLHSRLGHGARVVFVDMLRRDHPDLRPYRRDEGGNLICRRSLPDGRTFDVVKNFPTEDELRRAIGCEGDSIEYREWPGLGRWLVTYTVPVPPPN
jgi:demethylmenaquinone methyltransferase/2-methoxy-6-polyprenyl-1,4-benzoquinol methylase